MSETVIFTFRVVDGVITEADEYRPGHSVPPTLTSRRDIEVAVDRVANTPVGGRDEQ